MHPFCLVTEIVMPGPVGFFGPAGGDGRGIAQAARRRPGCRPNMPGCGWRQSRFVQRGGRGSRCGRRPSCRGRCHFGALCACMGWVYVPLRTALFPARAPVLCAGLHAQGHGAGGHRRVPPCHGPCLRQQVLAVAVLAILIHSAFGRACHERTYHRLLPGRRPEPPGGAAAHDCKGAARGI